MTRPENRSPQPEAERPDTSTPRRSRAIRPDDAIRSLADALQNNVPLDDLTDSQLSTALAFADHIVDIGMEMDDPNHTHTGRGAITMLVHSLQYMILDEMFKRPTYPLAKRETSWSLLTELVMKSMALM